MGDLDESLSASRIGPCLMVWEDAGHAPRVPMDLHTACALGDYDCVRNHLRLSGDVNALNKEGWTALIYAAYVGHDTVVNLLIEEGKVDVNRASAANTTPLMWAATSGNESVAYFLIQNGAKIDLTNDRGWTALMHAAERGHHTVIKLLLDNNANIEQSDPRTGNTPLLLAIIGGHEMAVQTLLDHGARSDVVNIRKETAHSLARNRARSTAILNLLDRVKRDSPTEDLRTEAGLGLSFTAHSPDKSLDSLDSGPDIRAAHAALFNKRQQDNDPVLVPQQQHHQQLDQQQAYQHQSSLPLPQQQLQDEHQLYQQPQQHYNQQGERRLIQRQHSAPHDLITHRQQDFHQAESSPPSGSRTTGSPEGKSLLSPGNMQTPQSHPHRVSHQPPSPVHPSPLPLSPMGDGGPQALQEFLKGLNLAKYIPVFEREEIDLATLLTMDEADLKDIGIKLFGPRRKIAAAIARWHESNNNLAEEEEVRQLTDQLRTSFQQTLHHEVHSLTTKLEELSTSLSQAEAERLRLREQLAIEKQLRGVAESSLRRDHTVLQQDNHRAISPHQLPPCDTAANMKFPTSPASNAVPVPTRTVTYSEPVSVYMKGTPPSAPHDIGSHTTNAS
eukprot:m.78664 g.78664  ORF g.78664 m.78664 type:complete len:615 (+) comp20781_c0_seq3:138-1982(+)